MASPRFGRSEGLAGQHLGVDRRRSHRRQPRFASRRLPGPAARGRAKRPEPDGIARARHRADPELGGSTPRTGGGNGPAPPRDPSRGRRGRPGMVFTSPFCGALAICPADPRSRNCWPAIAACVTPATSRRYRSSASWDGRTPTVSGRAGGRASGPGRFRKSRTCGGPGSTQRSPRGCAVCPGEHHSIDCWPNSGASGTAWSFPTSDRAASWTPRPGRSRANASIPCPQWRSS